METMHNMPSTKLPVILASRGDDAITRDFARKHEWRERVDVNENKRKGNIKIKCNGKQSRARYKKMCVQITLANGKTGGKPENGLEKVE
jgi:hypothetical protein